MRKRLYCMLCVFLCLLLCSCQSEHASLLTMVEAGKYSEAIEYINQLAREEIYADQEGKEPHPLTPYLYGTWESAVDEDAPTFVFNADGTCSVSGQPHFWRQSAVKETVENRVQFDILFGNKLAFTFQLIQWSDGVYSGSADQKKNDSVTLDHISNLRNRAHYRSVEITKENWDTYFEFVCDYVFEENTVTGKTDLVCYAKFKLKDQHYSMLDTTLSNVTAQYEFFYGIQFLSYDVKQKTYAVDGEYILLTVFSSEDDFRDSHGKEYSVRVLTSCAITNNAGEQYLYGFPSNFKVSHIEGELYWTADKEFMI